VPYDSTRAEIGGGPGVAGTWPPWAADLAEPPRAGQSSCSAVVIDVW